MNLNFKLLAKALNQPKHSSENSIKEEKETYRDRQKSKYEQLANTLDVYFEEFSLESTDDNQTVARQPLSEREIFDFAKQEVSHGRTGKLLNFLNSR